MLVAYYNDSFTILKMKGYLSVGYLSLYQKNKPNRMTGLGWEIAF
ncbi:hypothetical protein STRMA_1201 [Streptococcus macacae NCTC 11558]|uniref:Uncharacterized protein n=1 Tax=Streptococcus macacae NCTC 11558 TaxID=764298 RepID=G5JWR4_9STRE|nr:hypothetical protein STRMA_1201 [Streptococcus macacae NCTC 11558]